MYRDMTGKSYEYYLIELQLIDQQAAAYIKLGVKES